MLEKVLVDSEAMERRDGDIGNEEKTCAHCGTSKTPLWRSGPSGPKSLCNACGIRNSKKRLREYKKPKKSDGLKRNPKVGESLKEKLMYLGRRERWTVEKQRRKLGEEEQAAVLLMALSYGSVYA